MPLDVDALVTSNDRLSESYNVLGLAAPGIAGLARPGQFVMVKQSGASAPLLRRPFSIFELLRDAAGAVTGLSLLNKRVGVMTEALYALEPGARLCCLGPLGRPFSAPDRRGEAWMVAGGVGLAPFATLAAARRAAHAPVTLFYGGRSAPDLVYVEGFRRLGVRVELATEAGSWAVVAAITGGEIDVGGVEGLDLEPLTAVLAGMRVRCEVGGGGRFVVRPSRPRAVRQITTAPWPGFPSDMVSLVTVLATQAAGRTLIHDWMYELRLFALEQLSGMGANLFLCDPHRILVEGGRALNGRTLDTRDLRSGMALIAAALAARGESRISPLETVERGYASVVDRLRALGARVAVED